MLRCHCLLLPLAGARQHPGEGESRLLSEALSSSTTELQLPNRMAHGLDALDCLSLFQ